LQIVNAKGDERYPRLHVHTLAMLDERLPVTACTPLDLSGTASPTHDR
jgi:hypothetical protein